MTSLGKLASECPSGAPAFRYSVPYTCHEVAHTWTASCKQATLDTAISSFKFSMKVYTTFYVGTGLLKLRKKKYRNKKEILKLIRSILQSSVFLASNGTMFMFFYCGYRRLFQKLFIWNGLAAGFSTGFFSIHLERKSRRAPLATYVLNLALETAYLMAKSRNWTSGINHGEVLIFAFASAGFMAMFRDGNALDSSLRNPLQFLVGGEECGATKRSVTALTSSTSVASSESSYFIRAKNNFQSFVRRLVSNRFLPFKHQMCPHHGTCLHYTLEGVGRQVVVGYLLQLALDLLQLLRRRKKSKIFRDFSLALFLGSYVGLFRLCNCLLRWARDGDSGWIHGAVAGGVAGLSSAFYKSTTLSLYALCKLLEIWVTSLVERGWFPRVPSGVELVYASALSVILNAAWLEPHNIRPNYWRFLLGVSGDRFPFMFRKMVECFNPHASALYPNFVPDYGADRRHVTSPDIVDFMLKHSPSA